jgi:hypothetical protein
MSEQEYDRFALWLSEVFEAVRNDEDGWEDKIAAVERILAENPDLAAKYEHLADQL